VGTHKRRQIRSNKELNEAGTTSITQKIKLKILIIHNYYRSFAASGENVVFEQERDLLISRGHDVHTFITRNDDWEKFGTLEKALILLETPWSVRRYREIRQLVRDLRPDVVHIHNIFPLISPSIFWACNTEGVPSVLTLHNFRLICPRWFSRKGQICEKCLHSTVVWSLIHGCYKNSRIKTFIVACLIILNRFLGTWSRKVDAFIALTEFNRSKMIEAGVPPEKIFVKPNFLSDPPREIPDDRENYALFLGRISPEKGLDTLLEAWREFPGLPLHILGEGQQRGACESFAQKHKINSIHFLGRKPHSECVERLLRARVLLMPSVCYEGFPMTVREAFACGTPVIASRLGSLGEILEDGVTGLLFEPGNAKDLAQKVRWLWEHPEEARRMGQNARRVFEEKYTAEKNYEMLMGIYQKAIARTHGYMSR